MYLAYKVNSAISFVGAAAPLVPEQQAFEVALQGQQVVEAALRERKVVLEAMDSGEPPG